MHRTQPFQRFNILMSAVATLMGSAQAVTREQAIAIAGGYKSHGKTGSRSHNRGGTRAFQRAALKRRNQQRNRLAHRR